MLLDSNKVMETRLCPSRGYSPYREESGDEEMSVLPRHTKVVVTGNNRTKSVLVGLQGVVKKAVGLGGWHWLVLKNGVEVKLQRNALSVLEPPTGNEDDDGCDFDDSSCGSDHAEKDKHHFSTSVEFSKFTKPRIRYAKPWVSVASRKSSSLNSCRDDVQPDSQIPQLGIDFAKLGTSSLWRYCKSFKLANISSNLTREQLVSIVEPHFSSQHVDEVQVIVEFIRAAKRPRKNS